MQLKFSFFSEFFASSIPLEVLLSDEVLYFYMLWIWNYGWSCQQVLDNCSVCKVVVSGHPDFKPGDLLWGVTGWEEYSLIPNPMFCHRINHHEFPLSYYTGVLGEFSTLLC